MYDSKERLTLTIQRCVVLYNPIDLLDVENSNCFFKHIATNYPNFLFFKPLFFSNVLYKLFYLLVIIVSWAKIVSVISFLVQIIAVVVGVVIPVTPTAPTAPASAVVVGVVVVVVPVVESPEVPVVVVVVVMIVTPTPSSLISWHLWLILIFLPKWRVFCTFRYHS